MRRSGSADALGRLTRPGRLGREVDEEVAFHIEGRVEELVARGWTPTEAREEALRQFGDPARYRDECRTIARNRMTRERRGEVMGNVRQDIRFALRSFGRSPGFASVAALTLALGIGATTAVFTVAKDVLFDPLPFSDPDRLVMIWERNSGQNIERELASPPNYADWLLRNRTFEDLAAIGDGSLTLSGLEQPTVVEVAYVTANTFELFGVGAQLGRALRPGDATLLADEEVTGASLVVMSDGLWKSAFGADPAVLGSTIELNGTAVEVVGVMPAEFGVPRPDIDLWLPADYTAPTYGRQRRDLRVFGRLAREATVEFARADLDRIQASIAEIHPEANTGWTTDIVPVQEEVVGASTRRMLLLLLGAVGFVLLIACANVANLLLGRSSTREREIGVRTALGASRGRVVGQLLTESVVLGVAGGVLGTALAIGGVDLLIGLEPTDLPRLEVVGVDAATLAFAAGASLSTALLFGLVPALQASRRSVADTLRGSIALGQGSPERARSMLVVAEIAISLVLLVGAGLLTRSLLQLRTVDPGFTAENVIVARVNLGAEYATNASRANYFDEVLRRLREAPGIAAAGVTSVLPMDPAGIDFDLPYLAEGQPARPEGELPQTDYRIASEGYFEAMGMEIVRGRAFESLDRAETARVLVVNESFAGQLWPGQDPIGKTITIYYVNDVLWEVVGVVEDTRHRGLGAPAPAQMYVPASQAEFLFGYMHLAVRTNGAPETVRAVSAAGVAVDPKYPLYGVSSMASIISATTERDRFAATLLGAFALLALCLAAVGIHGVMAYQVSERTREIGLRMALGANRSTVLREVLKRAVSIAIAGVAIGALGAAATSRVVSSFLVDVSPLDPVTFGGTSGILVVVTVVAALAPAIRAASMDPSGALRSN
jgi:predicted permease